MRGFRIKPNLKAMDFSKIKPEQIECFFSTQVLDKMICKRENIEWNQELADKMDEVHISYFVVKTNMEYNVVSSEILSSYINSHNLNHNLITEKAIKCIKHYLKALQ